MGQDGGRDILSVDPEYPVVLEDYRPQWLALFETERARIRAAIALPGVSVEHIGSTAVPGLAAKPIIDILIGLRHLEDAAVVIPPLEGLGYEYIPQRELDTPERRFLARPETKPRTHHIHLVEFGSDFWERHLLFRDHLRTHADAAREYASLKRALAAQFRENREAYTEGKTAFVRWIEEAARSSGGDAVPPGLRAHAMKAERLHEPD